MPNIREIRRSTYIADICNDEEIKTYFSSFTDKITEEELKKCASVALSSLSAIINDFDFVKDAAHFQILANGLRNGLEENYQNNLHDEQQSKMYYKNLNAFLTGNLERLNSPNMRLKKPVNEEQTPIISQLARKCISLCLDELNKDIKKYAEKKQISWAGQVERIKVTEISGEYKNKRTAEDLKDNEGNSEEWKGRIKRLKKLNNGKENNFIDL